MNIIYKITDIITNKKYIGSKCDWKGDGTYYGSSKDPEMLSIIKKRKEDLKFEILEIIDDKNKICERELWWQKVNRVVEDPSFWNKRYAGSWSNYAIGRNLTEEEKERKRMDKEAHRKTSTKIKKIWKEIKESGKSYFSKDGLEKIKEEGRKVGNLKKSSSWREKQSKRRKGEKNTAESKIKTSESLKKLYLDKSIKNGMSVKIISIPISGGDPVYYENKTEAAKSINKQRYHINKVLDKNEEFCGYFWETRSQK